MRDAVEMKDKEEEMRSEIELLRKTLASWEYLPYHHQPFNKDECPASEWRLPFYADDFVDFVLARFDEKCHQYRSFEFSVKPERIGEVKHCSYSELQKITDFKPDSLIQETLSGRLFRGSIGEGSEQRPAIVKTWDFFLPELPLIAQRLYKFCDEIELFTDEQARAHPNLVKLHSFCCDTRLAAVYVEEPTGSLSDVLLADDFGWDKRIGVATQLAGLLAWLQEKGISVGSVTASCILIDEKARIKVFDFGFVSHRVDKDSKIRLAASVGREAPDIARGERTMRSDVFIFGLLLLELITKEKFDLCTNWWNMRDILEEKSKSSEKGLVHECFMDVNAPTASGITSLTLSCLSLKPEERPTMKYVSDTLRRLRMEAGAGYHETEDLSTETRAADKRKRDEYEVQLGLAEDGSEGREVEMGHGG